MVATIYLVCYAVGNLVIRKGENICKFESDFFYAFCTCFAMVSNNYFFHSIELIFLFGSVRCFGI
jgi:hypothetical protein